MTKRKLTEAKVAKQLDRIAPDWPLHLHDSAVIDHILKVINIRRISRTEITRPPVPAASRWSSASSRVLDLDT